MLFCQQVAFCFIWMYKEFKFSNIEFPASEYKVSWCNFISEASSYLGYAERQFHPCSFLDKFEVHEHCLGCFPPQVSISFIRGTCLCFEHLFNNLSFVPIIFAPTFALYF